MTVKRQPGRPSEREFVDAALRFDHEMYVPVRRLIWTQFGYGGATIPPEVQRQEDLAIIQAEYDADGIVSGMTLARYVVQRLGVYTKGAPH